LTRERDLLEARSGLRLDRAGPHPRAVLLRLRRYARESSAGRSRAARLDVDLADFSAGPRGVDVPLPQVGGRATRLGLVHAQVELEGARPAGRRLAERASVRERAAALLLELRWTLAGLRSARSRSVADDHHGEHERPDERCHDPQHHLA